MLAWILGIVSTLGLVGTIAAAIAFPSVVIPILQAIMGRILKCKPCMALLVAIALVFSGALYGAHVEHARSEARLEKMRQAAAAAARQRDVEVKQDLEKKYQPQISVLEDRAKQLQEEVAKYEKQKPVVAVGACKLGADALRLRQLPPR